MQFRVVPAVAPDPTTPPQFLICRPLRRCRAQRHPAAGADRGGCRIASTRRRRGRGPPRPAWHRGGDPNIAPGMWTRAVVDGSVTENPAVGATEVWEFYNATGDAHPMHIHEIAFEVVNRQAILVDEATRRSRSSPARRRRRRSLGDRLQGHGHRLSRPGHARAGAVRHTPGQFVWHCHIVEHEDNEMMRPYRIGPVQPGQPG